MTPDTNDPFSDSGREDAQEKENEQNLTLSFKEIKNALERDKKVASKFDSIIGHYAVETKIRNNRVYSCTEENGNELDDFDLRFPSEQRGFIGLESAAKQHLKHCDRVRKYITEKEVKIGKFKRLKQFALGILIVGPVVFYSFPHLFSWIEKWTPNLVSVNHYENMVKVDLKVGHFWIDKTEVSIREYKQFDPRYKRPKRFSSDELPVVNVTWENAKKFAENRGKRLCSSDEWLQALGSYENLARNAYLRDNPMAVPRIVSDNTEINEKGILNMLGNVKEWVSDSSGDGAFAIGGYWQWNGNSLSELTKPSEKTDDRIDRKHYTGFRCCKD